MTRRRLIIVGSFAESFIDFRGNLAMRFLNEGYEVFVLLPPCDAALAESIRTLGVVLIHYKIERTGKNPLSDLATIRSLRQVFKEQKPTHVLAYTIKPVIYSQLALRLMSSNARSFALITGLGYLFTANSLKTKLARRLVLPMYRQALKRCEKAFFQNPDDKHMFIHSRLICEEKTGLLAGSGVDMNHYSVAPLPDKPVFLMVARLVRDKGIHEFFTAATRIRRKFPTITFNLVGYLDDNPTSLTEPELSGYLEQSGVIFHGYTNDVRPFISLASVFVLPSYREGTPRSVLEAMSMGRAIITSDAPGCRETVVDGVNGLLVEPKSVDDLVRAMQTLVDEPHRIVQMGDASRDRVRCTFDDDIVNASIVRALH